MCILPLRRWWRWKKMREPEKWAAIRWGTAMWPYCPCSLVQGAPTKDHSSFDRHCYVNTRQALLTSGVGIRVYPHKLWDWGMELGSGFISAPPYPCALLCSLPWPPPEPGWPDQYLLWSALNSIYIYIDCEAVQYQASASSINLFFIQCITVYVPLV